VAEVIPGIIETRIPPRLPVMIDMIEDFLAFLSNVGDSIVCLGITGFVLKDVKLNLVIVEEELKDGKKVKRVFATNEEYDEKDVKLLERLFDIYGKRWGIETSYRVKKHSYLPKTTSKNYYIRLFYFMFSVLLYNLWILADVLIWLHLFGKVGKKHLLTSKYFGSVLMAIDPGG